MTNVTCAVLTATMFAGLSAVSQAHEGHDHDHGSERGGRAAPETNSPPPPPGDAFVPESRPSQNGPTFENRTPRPTPRPGNQRSRDFQQFEPQPRDFAPESRPFQSDAPSFNRPPHVPPPAGRWPTREFHDVAPMHGFEFESGAHLRDERSSRDRRRFDCDGGTCPLQNDLEPSQPCPFGNDRLNDCPWENGPRFGRRHDDVQEFPSQCPTGR